MSKIEKYGLIGIAILLVVAIIVSAVVSVKPKTSELSNDPDTIYNNAQIESESIKDSEKG